MQASPARDFFVFVATPYGPVAFDDGQLRWSADSVTWHGIRTDGNRKWITTDGADVILFGEGFTRYAWEDDGWSKVMEVNLPGAVQSIAFGPNGAVALVDNLVYYSVDGISFALADVGPGEVPGVDRAAGCVIPGPLDAFAGDGNGPILVTETGYVILAPTAANWDQALCEPLVWASTDGNRWELLTERSPFGATAGIRDVAAYAGRFVAVGGFAETEEGAVWVSTDGIDWQRADVDVETALAIDGGDLGWFLTGIADDSEWSGPGFLIHMWFSVDGAIWDGPYKGPGGLGMAYFRTEPSVGSDAIVSVNIGHDGLVIGRLQE